MSNGKNVVHFINCLPAIGGAERLILDLADCSQNGPVPVIAWWGRDNSLLQFDTRKSIDLISLRPFRFSELKRAICAFKRADVVHLHLFPSMYLAPFMRKPTLFTEHNTWNARRDHAWARPIERWCYRFFDMVVAISPDVATSVTDWIGGRPRRLSVIPNGIRLDRFDRAPRHRIGDPVVIGMAARFTRQKDHETLVRCIAELPSSYRLKLAGDGPLRGSIEALAHELRVLDRIEFTGIVHDMPAFYRSIDIYVQSTNSDGFSLVAVEAMASGLPVLGSDVPGLRGTIGRADLLFAHKDASALARRVLELAQDSAKYTAMSRYCVQRAGQFDIETTARQYERAYAEIGAEG